MVLTNAEKSARYRAKDVEAYRIRKAALAREPKQKETRKKYMRRWREANRVEYNAYANVYNTKRRSSRDPDDRHAEHVKRVYGISRDEYALMAVSQNGKCAICECTKPRGHGRWVIDHCHSSGMIRGLLCNWCNARLGWYERWKDQAAAYLLKGPYQFDNGPKLKRTKERKAQELMNGEASLEGC